MERKRKITRSHTNVKKRKLNEPTTTFEQMNDHCSLHIFQFLNIIELVQICKVNERFSGLINQFIIPRRTINCCQYRDVLKISDILEMFGKSITRITMTDKEITNINSKKSKMVTFFELLTRYGEPQILQELRMSFRDAYYKENIMQKNMSRVAP